VWTLTLTESDHQYANNFAYTWPAITESSAFVGEEEMIKAIILHPEWLNGETIII